MTSKAFLMLIVWSSVRFTGRLELMLGNDCWARLVRSVVIEWFGQNPCCVNQCNVWGGNVLDEFFNHF